MIRAKLIFKFFMLALIFCFSWVTPGFSEISVYDSNDQYLGVLCGTGDTLGGHLSIFIPQLDLPARISDDGDLDRGGSGVSVLFETDDCSGIPYLPYFSAAYPYTFKGSCEIYYHVSNNHKSFVSESYYNDQCECIKYTNTFNEEHVELSVFPKENFPFTLPLAMPLYFKYISGGDINGDGKTGLEEAVNALQVTSGLKE